MPVSYCSLVKKPLPSSGIELYVKYQSRADRSEIVLTLRRGMNLVKRVLKCDMKYYSIM